MFLKLRITSDMLEAGSGKKKGKSEEDLGLEEDLEQGRCACVCGGRGECVCAACHASVCTL